MVNRACHQLAAQFVRLVLKLMLLLDQLELFRRFGRGALLGLHQLAFLHFDLHRMVGHGRRDNMIDEALVICLLGRLEMTFYVLCKLVHFFKGYWLRAGLRLQILEFEEGELGDILRVLIVMDGSGGALHCRIRHKGPKLLDCGRWQRTHSPRCCGQCCADQLFANGINNFGGERQRIINEGSLIRVQYPLLVKEVIDLGFQLLTPLLELCLEHRDRLWGGIRAFFVGQFFEAIDDGIKCLQGFLISTAIVSIRLGPHASRVGGQIDTPPRQEGRIMGKPSRSSGAMHHRRERGAIWSVFSIPVSPLLAIW
ncbi:conserved hypothetical protein [Ricinus communis]|uniref:Uncharacterized protein n=1 Tax=Ricinus communis TaxID=3988 RepID=B9TIJ7_RICCO|nr:conserved hypothetical protein [Ricinus communis]